MARTRFSLKQLLGFISNRQNNTTNNANPTDQRIEMGWGFTTGTGTTYADKAITFATAFSSPPIIIVSNIGYKDSSDPTSNTDISGPWELPQPTTLSPSASGFTVRMGTSNGTTYASSRRILFSWIAIGS